jgi:hypothetical protein
MIDPPEQRTYARGETIHATLRVRWREQFDTIVMEFHKLHSPFGGKFGNRIELHSRHKEQIDEGPSPYIEVDLQGIVPDWANPGTYVCRYVRCSVPGGGWVVLFEDVHQITLRIRSPVLPSPPRSKEGAEFLGFEFHSWGRTSWHSDNMKPWNTR